MKQNLTYDVVIIGGGPAGTVAAIASARSGARTLLVEQNGYLGGMLTMAGTGPQMTFHAGSTQVVQGIAEEIVARMVKEGFSPGHMEDFVGYASSVTPFDAEGMKLILESMVKEAGADLLYHTVYTGCEWEDRKIRKVRLYAKQGFFDVSASVFIDASADADLATHAGIGSVYGREEDHLAQPMTMNVKVSNVDRDKMMEYIKKNSDDMLETIPFERLQLIPRSGMQGAYSVISKAKEKGEFPIDRDMVLCFETNNPGEYILNMSRIIKKSALDSFDLTEAEIEGRKQAHAIVAFMRNYIPGFENAVIVTTGPHIGVRESRKINGAYRLTASDLLQNKMFEDAIAMGGYPIDIHSPDGGTMEHHYLKKGSWYSIPYRCLYTNELDNLLVAGRCISATHEACAAVRVTPILMAISEGAGTAAAIAAKQGIGVAAIDIAQLQNLLKDHGAFLEPYE
ncbi:FAD-dependent oxidoreductase [Lacrimispora sp.]|uniref:FAD-dependent oxidoreductase n=1 Tax=Lacrimispora sp. TaxID=2719234 RepID=UPI002864C0F8|nr:FAD-dependent oxidoreductase [Lacrimispora sp.]MDR7812729.1 FAD-dependent oxidoreductase [Lacrimispora sp.]